MKLGKLPARINSVYMKLGAYLDMPAVLPMIPDEFGHENLIADFGMLANDQVGDCVWAGAAHETMLWCREAGSDATFSAGSVLSDYTAATGYDPDDPSTDQGTDMQAAASYRRRIGVLDATGRRHKVGAYVALTVGDPDQLAAAAYIFGAVGVGLRFPDYAMDEFTAGKPWALRHGIQKIAGGHYVAVTGRGKNGNFRVITWGKVQEMTPGFYRRYCDEALVYFSSEFLTAGVSPEGFNLAQLRTDLRAFTRR
ncbi:hypothetical protein [Nocardia sp. NPDC051463]|uniref:hypothetical protein n=1 Tax=Nocardia sp. NPDC051463 TaxID=3154845 RepID=UPI00344E21D2